MFSTALVHAHEIGDAYVQNDKKGVPRNARNPPGSATVQGELKSHYSMLSGPTKGAHYYSINPLCVGNT
jgi:hypothetical protein